MNAGRLAQFGASLFGLAIWWWSGKWIVGLVAQYGCWAMTVFPVWLVVIVMGWLAFLVARIAFRILWEMRTRAVWVSDLVADRTVSAVMDPIDEFLLRVVGQPRPPKPQENKDEVIEARDVLGLPERFTRADVKSRYRHLAMRLHPDQGGTTWLQARINWAAGVLDRVAVE